MVKLLLIALFFLVYVSYASSRKMHAGSARVVAKESATDDDGKVKMAPLSVIQTLFAGGTARALSQAVTYPMDALRTIAQTRQGAKSLSELGASALVSGCIQTSTFAFPLGAVQFSVFGSAKKAITSVVGPATGGMKGTGIAIGASMCASLASCLVGVPQEILKQRLVTGIYSDFATALKTIWASEGLKGFYTGWAPTVARNLPYVTITFTTFNHWKTQELKRTGSADLDTRTALKFGMGASLIACIMTQPIDVIKTRMMTQAASNLVPYTSAMNCITDMFKTEGISSFYSGIVARAAYISPMWGAQFLLNEKFCRAMGEWNYRRQQRPKKTGIQRGPSPGKGRSAWVKHKGLVWTVGVPMGRANNADIGTQTKMTLDAIDKRLADAGTDKSKIIEATCFLADMKGDFAGFDQAWKEWLPEGSGASRATVGVSSLANNDKVEIKVTVAA